MDASAAGLIRLIARRLALALVFSFVCSVAVVSGSPLAAVAPPPASPAVVGSAAAGQDALGRRVVVAPRPRGAASDPAALTNEGFDASVPHGLFGPRTRSAIRRWQEVCGLPVTGYLDDRQSRAAPGAGGATRGGGGIRRAAGCADGRYHGPGSVVRRGSRSG